MPVAVEDWYLSEPGKEEGVEVVRLTYEQWPQDFRLVRRDRSNVAFFVVLKGRGMFLGTVGRQRIEPGGLFCMVPGVHHEIHCVGGDGLTFHRVVFKGTAAVEWVQRYLGGYGRVWSVGRLRTVVDIVRAMMDQVKRGGEKTADICRHYLQIFLLQIAEGMREDVSGRRSRQPATFLAAKSMLDADYLSRRRLDDIANACGVSYGYLCRLFKQFEQCGPGAYRRALRLDYAARELAQTSRRVGEIAWDAGYDDLYTFSKAFRRHTGLSPRHYRANVWERDASL